MLTAPDIISHINASRDKMSKGELRIADAVLGDIEFAVHATTAELAKTAAVSLPTITRFCRTVGCDGVQDFKLALAKTLTVGRRYLRRQNGDAHSADHPAARMLASVHQALNTLAAQIQVADLERAAAAIAAAGKVFIFGGGGGSSVIAQDAEYRLFRLGIAVSCCNDTQLQYMMAAMLKKNDVLLCVSTGGRYLELVKAAEIAGQYGAEVIALTAPDTPLAAAATLPLPVHIPESEDILMPTASRYALLASIDIIAALVAIALGAPARENLRRIKYQLVTLRDGEDRQPLGD